MLPVAFHLEEQQRAQTARASALCHYQLTPPTITSVILTLYYRIFLSCISSTIMPYLYPIFLLIYLVTIPLFDCNSRSLSVTIAVTPGHFMFLFLFLFFCFLLCFFFSLFSLLATLHVFPSMLHTLYLFHYLRSQDYFYSQVLTMCTLFVSFHPLFSLLCRFSFIQGIIMYLSSSFSTSQLPSPSPTALLSTFSSCRSCSHSRLSLAADDAVVVMG